MQIKDKSKKSGLSRFQIILMAIAAGASVANIYYNQPILKEIAASFGSTEKEAGIVSMLSQIGYGLGLFFIIPLGDKINKKKLILVLSAFLIISLFLMAVSSSIQQVWALSVLIGILSVSVQVIVPMAASLDPVNRGKTVGTVFSGILVGILAARVFSGFIAELLGWRFVYGISGGLIFVLTLFIKFFLPDVENRFEGHYLELLKSTLIQIKRFSQLRKVSLMGALVFGAFCSFWTTLTFKLSGAPFYFHPDIIGLFGLVAIAGALIAPLFGKMADRGQNRRSLFLALSFIIISLLFLKLIPDSVLVFVIAVLLLDIGTQIVQVTNMATIYSLDESSNSRINTIFMTTIFIGGAFGTYAGLFCWQHGGWEMVLWQLILWNLAAASIIKFIHNNKAKVA